MVYENYEHDIKFYCIWNPATKDFKKIPLPPLPPPESDNPLICIHAFGYDCQNDDYKLLVLTATHSNVFTLVLNRWQSIPVAPYDWWPECEWNGVLVNGKLHWVIMSDYSRNIVYLDISNEKFEVMQLPIPVPTEYTTEYWDKKMIPGVLDGCLCLLVEIIEDGSFDLWVMQDYGVPESWIKRHTITNEIITKGFGTFDLEIVGNFTNGQILFLGHSKMMLYDLNHGSVITRNIRSAGITSADTYLESFISLDTGTYMGRIQIEESTETS